MFSRIQISALLIVNSNDLSIARFAMIMYSRQLRCICLLLCVVCFVPALLGHKLPLTCGRIATQTIPLIRKGISAVDGQWPWHAAIFHRKNNTMEYACGGSIIDQSTILTGMRIKYCDLCVTLNNQIMNYTFISSGTLCYVHARCLT